MHNYKVDLKKVRVCSIHQRCMACNQWYQVDAETLAQALDAWTAKPKPGEIGVPWQWAKCAHCGKSETLNPPGKYDKPNAPLNQCEVQRVITEKCR